MDCDILQRARSQLDAIDKESIKKLDVVLLPDFFVDHIVSFPNFQQSIHRVEECFQQGGGNMPGLSQILHQGGNAANTALALARLGVNSHLICKTNLVGFHLLELFLEPHGVDLSHIQSDGSLASTVALEFGENHSNIFLQDAGSVANFGVDNLTENDWNIIGSTHLVGVMNWSLNKRGTELAKHVFEYAKRHMVKTYMDTGDPSPRSDDIPAFIHEVLSSGLVDCFSLNENEIRKYSGISYCEKTEEIIETCRLFHEVVKTRLDVHTALFSHTITDTMQVTVPTISLPKIYRATGAGDVWNAGNIVGELLCLSFEHRLLFANSLAACYISKKEPLPPTFDEVERFLNHVNDKE